MTEAAPATPTAGTNGAAPPSAAPPAASPDAGSQAAPGPSSPAERPDFFPESHWNAETGEPNLQSLVDDWQGLNAKVGEMEAARPVAPESADKYEIKLPEGFKTPDGAEIALMADDDPIMGETVKALREFAHTNGFSQEQFSGLVALKAQADIAEQTALGEASKAEMESLGANGTARVDGITRFLVGHLGETKAKSLLGTLFTKAQVEAYETLIHKFTSKGVPSPKPGGEPGGASNRAEEISQLGQISSATARFAKARELTAPKK